MMTFVTVISVVVFVVGYLISQTCEFPSNYQKFKCNIEKDFNAIFNGQKCSNFVYLGKFNNEIYGIEIVEELIVKHWKINSKEATDSDLNIKDQAVTKIVKHNLNETQVRVVFQSGVEYYLLQWNLASPMETNVWPITAETLSDFVFQNSTLLVFSAISNELFVTQYKLIDGKDPSFSEDAKIVTMENEARKIHVSNTEIILEDVNFNVVKVNFRNLVKFFNESGATATTNTKASEIPWILGILGGIIIGIIAFGLLALYFYLNQYELIKKSNPQQSNSRKPPQQKQKTTLHADEKTEEEEEKILPNPNESQENEENAKNMVLVDTNSNNERINENSEGTTHQNGTNHTVAENNAVENESNLMLEEHGEEYENDYILILQNNLAPANTKSKSIATQTSENEKTEENVKTDIELGVHW